MDLNFSRLDDLAGIAPEFTYEDEPGADREAAKADFVLVPGDAMATASRLKHEILHDLYAGEPEYIPLLKAVQAVALLTQDAAFLENVRKTLTTVHGDALGRDIPPEWLLEGLETNRQQLEKTLKRKNLKPDTRKRIEEALAATTDKIDTIQGSLFEG